MVAVPHSARTHSRDDERTAFLAKRMLAWNSACGGVALIIYLVEKLAA